MGAGYIVDKLGKEVVSGRASLGPRADVFDAETLALALAAQKACNLAISSPHPTVRFFVDNIAAVDMIHNLKLHPAQASSILFRQAVDKLLRNNPWLGLRFIGFQGTRALMGTNGLTAWRTREACSLQNQSSTAQSPGRAPAPRRDPFVIGDVHGNRARTLPMSCRLFRAFPKIDSFRSMPISMALVTSTPG